MCIRDRLLTQGAEQDLEAIHDYIRTSDGITHATVSYTHLDVYKRQDQHQDPRYTLA